MLDILTLEAVSNRMWCAAERIEYDGWLLQFAHGYTRRPNSVSILHPSTLPLAEKLAFCEAGYAKRHLKTQFKLLPTLAHTEVDAFLEANGYGLDESNWVMTAPLAKRPLPREDYYTQFNDEWMGAFVRMKRLSPQLSEAHAAILGRITGKTCYATVRRDGQIVAVGLGVVEGDYCGIYDVVTDAEYRGQGLGREMMAQLLAVASHWGATIGLLQVSGDNEAALRLYRGLGFEARYEYVYRSKRTSDAEASG
jgi:ribosomal protein S18 acetylase RimI-like enzyme